MLGLMAAGKTTVGRLLAERLTWPLSDSDQELEAMTGRTVREIRDEVGVQELHRMEAKHLLTALAADRPSIVCAAASVVEHEPCRRALRRPEVLPVWLLASPRLLAARFLSSPHRPVYGSDPRVFLAAQMRRRAREFHACDPLTVDVTSRTPAEVVALVLAEVARLRSADCGRCPPSGQVAE